MSVVIVHEELGVYLGHCLGLAWFTLQDPAGQDQAVVFDTVGDAMKHIMAWEPRQDPSSFSYIKVEATYKHYATISDLKRAGLGSLLGKMEYEALEYGDIAGSA